MSIDWPFYLQMASIGSIIGFVGFLAYNGLELAWCFATWLAGRVRQQRSRALTEYITRLEEVNAGHVDWQLRLERQLRIVHALASGTEITTDQLQQAMQTYVDGEMLQQELTLLASQQFVEQLLDGRWRIRSAPTYHLPELVPLQQVDTLV